MPNGNKTPRRPGGNPNFINEGRWILLFLIIAAVILLQAKGGLFSGTGGIRVGSPSSSGTVEEEKTGQPLPPPKPLPPLQGETPISPNDSSFKDKLTLQQGNALQSNPDKEYIELVASYSNKEKIAITGLTLTNSKSEKVTIGPGAYLPYIGQVNFEEPIRLNPGSRVFLVTGQSPIGANFRTNLCAGYFDEFKEFTPRIFEECPRPEDEPEAKTFDQACANFLSAIPRCHQPQGTAIGSTEECRNYITSKINYATCADNHKSEVKFYRNDWYVYFGRASELWKDRGERITLRDAAGKIITSLSY